MCFVSGELYSDVLWCALFQADFILICVSENYLNETEREQTEMEESLTDRQLHTEYIYQLMVQEYNQHGHNRRFIPVMLDGTGEEHIPSWLQNTLFYKWPLHFRDLLWFLTKPETRIKTKTLTERKSSEEEEEMVPDSPPAAAATWRRHQAWTVSDCQFICRAATVCQFICYTDFMKEHKICGYWGIKEQYFFWFEKIYFWSWIKDYLYLVLGNNMFGFSRGWWSGLKWSEIGLITFPVRIWSICFIFFLRFLLFVFGIIIIDLISVWRWNC